MPIVPKRKLPKAVLTVVDPDTVLMECSCQSRVFHILRKRVARKAKTKTAHRLRLVAKCVDCEKEIRLSFGGFNPY